MSQTRIASLKESASNTMLGFLIALCINVVCVHLIEDKTTAAIVLTLSCTVASLVRGYAVRRHYNRRAQEIRSERENTLVYVEAALKDYMAESTWDPALRKQVDDAISEARDVMLHFAEKAGQTYNVMKMGPGEIINGVAYLAHSGRVPAHLRADLLAIHDRSLAAAKAVLENWK